MNKIFDFSVSYIKKEKIKSIVFACLFFFLAIALIVTCYFVHNRDNSTIYRIICYVFASLLAICGLWFIIYRHAILKSASLYVKKEETIKEIEEFEVNSISDYSYCKKNFSFISVKVNNNKQEHNLSFLEGSFDFEKGDVIRVKRFNDIVLAYEVIKYE